MASIALMTAGCITQRGGYDPTSFAPWRIAEDQKLDGAGFVLTSEADDAHEFRGHPSGFVGSAGTLVIPLGAIARGAAVRVFGQLFRGGVEASSREAFPEGAVLSVSPRVISFAYWYSWPSTPFVKLSIRVLACTADGRVIYDKTLDSKEVEARATTYREQGEERVVRTTHLVIQALMLQAAEEIRGRVLQVGPSHPSGRTQHVGHLGEERT